MQDVTSPFTFPVWSVIPFIVLLLSIAVVPLPFPKWWDRNLNKLLLSIGAAIPVLAVDLETVSSVVFRRRHTVGDLQSL